MTVEEISHSSTLYQRTLVRREHLLRQPLGLVLSQEDTSDEESQRHFALVDGDALIGGLIARIEASDSARFRQMWIEPTRTGSGSGKQLLISAEMTLAGEGIQSFSLHARESARGFYLKCGYQPIGSPFTEVGIPHIAMTKTIKPEVSS